MILSTRCPLTWACWIRFARQYITKAIKSQKQMHELGWKDRCHLTVTVRQPNLDPCFTDWCSHKDSLTIYKRHEHKRGESRGRKNRDGTKSGQSVIDVIKVSTNGLNIFIYILKQGIFGVKYRCHIFSALYLQQNTEGVAGGGARATFRALPRNPWARLQTPKCPLTAPALVVNQEVPLRSEISFARETGPMYQ